MLSNQLYSGLLHCIVNPTCTWDSGGAGVSLGQTKIIAHHHHHRLQISLSPAHIILVQISLNPGNIFTDADDLVMIMVCNGSEQNLTPHFDRLLLFLSETVLLYYWARSIPSSLEDKTDKTIAWSIIDLQSDESWWMTIQFQVFMVINP